MDYWSLCFLFAAFLGTILQVSGIELTFELPDNEKQCFYQDIEKNVSSTLEFQVIIKKSGFVFLVIFQFSITIIFS